MEYVKAYIEYGLTCVFSPSRDHDEWKYGDVQSGGFAWIVSLPLLILLIFVAAAS